MAKKLNRKILPSGFCASDFKYEGRPAKTQGDFENDVGLSDMACVSQFGENKHKYYHCGVVSAKGKWFVYLEWGRVFSGKSWEGSSFYGQDYQFVDCIDEQDARDLFRKQSCSKNTKRLEEKKIAGNKVWVGKSGKDGYVVQSLATRERGLPDAYTIKDSSGLTENKKSTKKTIIKKTKTTEKFQKQVVDLAISLVGGTRDYARAASAATGVIPTLDTITEVRDIWLTAALERLKKVGDKFEKQIKDKDLIGISNAVAALVPRPIDRYASAEYRAEQTILSSKNILSIQQDLDAYEASLLNEDFNVEVSESNEINPRDVFGSEIVWIDPETTKGRWIRSTFEKMSNNRHSYMRGKVVIKNIFEVFRPKLDKEFCEIVSSIAKNNNDIRYRARLQPNKRSDITDISDYADKANVFLGIHGTRSVNVQPILKSNLRLPKQLEDVHISGAAFGHGIYFATDFRKSYGYTGHGGSYYGNGGGVKGRGFFMFLNDVIMGDAYMTRKTGSWNKAPDDKDSVAAFSEYTSVANDEHIIFNPNYQRIRYIIEADLV